MKPAWQTSAWTLSSARESPRGYQADRGRDDPDSETHEKQILLTDNEYREKTPAEKINEAEMWEAIEKEKARERQLSTLKEGDENPDRQNFDEREQGRSDEKAAEKVGVSNESYRKGKQVKDIAVGREDDVADEVRDVAQAEWEKMQTGETTFHGAKTTVDDVEKLVETVETSVEDVVAGVTGD